MHRTNSPTFSAGILATAGVLLVLATGCSPSEATLDKAEQSVPVRLIKLEERLFEERVQVDGVIETKTTALVTPRVAGPIEALYVDEGAPVKAGETQLFAVDRLKLEKAVEVGRQALAVAECGEREREANLERETAILNKAEIDYHRQQKLFTEEKIGTRDQVEQLESAYLQAKASVKHADTLVALAKEQGRQAEASLAMSEKDLRDALVIAPINGVISKRFQEVGDMGAPGVPVFRIDDTQALEVSVYLPARYFGRVEVGRTPMKVTLDGEVLGSFPVAYRSPTIDPSLRVFEVKCQLEDRTASAAPGALASVGITIDRRQGLAAPRESLSRRHDGVVVYRVENSKTVGCLVTPGLEAEGWVELVDSGLAPGTPIVTEGRFLLSEGTRVSVVEPGSKE